MARNRQGLPCEFWLAVIRIPLSQHTCLKFGSRWHFSLILSRRSAKRKISDILRVSNRENRRAAADPTLGRAAACDVLGWVEEI